MKEEILKMVRAFTQGQRISPQETEPNTSIDIRYIFIIFVQCIFERKGVETLFLYELKPLLHSEETVSYFPFVIVMIVCTYIATF